MDFRKIAADFCSMYYYFWNTSPYSLKTLFNNEKITYDNKEFTSFDAYLNFLKNQIHKIEFVNFKFISQPLEKSSILINISGVVNINFIPKKFNETIIIHKNLWEKYYIVNTIIRCD